MARTATPPPKVIDTPMNQDVLDQEAESLNQLAVITRETDERVHALAVKLKYEGSTDPAVLENSARDTIQRIGMGIFELGGYLLLMKEACGHGKFLPALERLGLQPLVAQRYMRITSRFSNTSSKTHLEALGKTKLLEMLVMDDEQLDELATLGQTGELSLDDVATMSVKELRHALREAKQEAKAKDQVLADKNAANDKLRAQLKRIATLPADQELAELKKEAASIAATAEAHILGGLRQALIAVNAHGDERGLHDVYLAGLVGQVQAQLNALREEFALPDVSGAGATFDPEASAAIREGLAQMRAAKAGGNQ